MVREEGETAQLWVQQRRLLYAGIGGLCIIAAVMVVAALVQGIGTAGTAEQIRENAQAQEYGIAALGALFAGLLSVFLYNRPTGLRVMLWIVGGLVAVATFRLYVH